MNYHHFTIEERCCLREYYVKGKSYREIARLLGRNVSSISREIMRNKTFMNAKPAQNAVRDENAVVQNHLSLDRRKISSFHS